MQNGRQIDLLAASIQMDCDCDSWQVTVAV